MGVSSTPTWWSWPPASGPTSPCAQACGIETARGVVVDDELRASAPGTWAVGECAEHRGMVYGLWAPLLRQAKVAAAVMSGRPAAFHGAVPATTLKVMGVDLFCAGRAQPLDGEEEVLFLDSRLAATASSCSPTTGSSAPC